MPPAFNLSQDQTLQFKFDCRFQGDKSLLDLHSKFRNFRKCSSIFLAIYGHRRSTHTNYLIRLLKSSPRFRGAEKRNSNRSLFGASSRSLCPAGLLRTRPRILAGFSSLSTLVFRFRETRSSSGSAHYRGDSFFVNAFFRITAESKSSTPRHDRVTRAKRRFPT